MVNIEEIVFFYVLENAMYWNRVILPLLLISVTLLNRHKVRELIRFSQTACCSLCVFLILLQETNTRMTNI